MAPASRTIRAVSSVCSRDSTVHGPAIIAKLDPPTLRPAMSSTVRSPCLNCVEESLYGFEIGTTRSTPGSALELEPRHVLAVADRADHGQLVAAAEVGARADALDSLDDGLYLLFCGRRFHHDHHCSVLSGAWELYESEPDGFHPTGGFFGARPLRGPAPARGQQRERAERLAKSPGVGVRVAAGE